MPADLLLQNIASFSRSDSVPRDSSPYVSAVRSPNESPDVVFAHALSVTLDVRTAGQPDLLDGPVCDHCGRTIMAADRWICPGCLVVRLRG